MTTTMTDFRVDLPPGDFDGWTIERYTVDERNAVFHNLRCALNHNDRHIVPGSYTRLKRDGDIWMSDTPAEIADLRPLLHASGRVLVVGLGLGVALKMLLANDAVTSVDVLELSRSLIERVAPHYDDPRLSVTAGDVFTHRWPDGLRWDLAWLDIWPTISSANVKEMAALKRRYSRRATAVRCWCERESRRMREQGRY